MPPPYTSHDVNIRSVREIATCPSSLLRRVMYLPYQVPMFSWEALIIQKKKAHRTELAPAECII